MIAWDNWYRFCRIERLALDADAGMLQVLPRQMWMLVPMAGTGTVKIGLQEEPIMLSGFEVLLSNSRDPLTLQTADSGEGWKLYLVSFEATPIRTSGEHHAAAEWLRRKRAEQVAQLCELAEQLHYAARMLYDRTEQALKCQMLLQQMLLWWHTTPDQAPVQRTTDQAVRDAAILLERQYAQKWGRDQLASRVGVADAYFSVLFKKSTGFPPSVYLDRIRVHRAAELLLTAHRQRGNLEEIAQRVGYRDAWYLSKRFRTRFGQSPSAFRDRFVPQHVAVLQYPYVHHLLALDEVPAIVRLGSNPHPQAIDRTGPCIELPVLMSTEAQMQALGKERPDLIITYDTEEVAASWRSVAPVCHISWLGLNWREHLRALASIMRKSQQAESAIDVIEQAAGRVQQQLGVGDGRYTVSIFKFAADRCYLYGVRDVGCIFYELLGFEPPQRIREQLLKEANLHSMELSTSDLPTVVSDLNIWIMGTEQEDHMDKLRVSTHWRVFEAATAGRMLYLDGRQWLHYDPLHLLTQLQLVSEARDAIVDILSIGPVTSTNPS